MLLSGEAGIGKSRLTAALLERLAGEPHTRLRYFCSPQHTDSAFYPIIGQMERAARLAHNDTPKAKLDKLDALLAQTSTSKQDAALFAELQSLPNDGRYPTLDLAPQARRQRTLQALISQIEVLTRSGPVLMIFEDAHWTDPSSLEVLGRVIDRIATLPVLLIVTFRPEFEPPWIGRPHVTVLTINRLTQQDVGAMIDRVIGNQLLPASIREDIIERTDGIPLFIEEMTKAVLEEESQGAAEHALAAIPSLSLAVPSSLHASLMARLDRLGAAKEVAQIGAAIGREFSHPLLVSVVGWREAELRPALEGLIAAGLLFRQGVPPHATYLFKHALVQDAAYGTLLRGTRRAFHARIADVLENQFIEIAENQPELLARHCTDAGMKEKAAGLWGKAGQRSLERSALVEATEQLKRALGQIADLPSTPTLRQEQIKLQVALINPLLHIKGHAASETKEAVERARRLIEQAEALGEPPEDPLLWFSVLFALFTAHFVAFDGNAMRELAAQFLALAEKKSAPVPLMIGHRITAVSLFATGAFAEGRAHFNRALALYVPAEHRSLATRFGQDPRASALGFRSVSVWHLGYPTAALADASQAVGDAREIGQAATLMNVLAIVAQTHILCGDYGIATTISKELVALAEEKGSPFWKSYGVGYQGLLSAFSGNASDGVRMIAAGMASLQSTGATLSAPWFLATQALAYADLAQFDDAWCSFDKAIETIEIGEEKRWEAEVNRIGGEIALMSSEPDMSKAELYFERALAIAREQQAKSWELRAAMSMARLWRDQDKRRQAHDLLAPVYGWFTEGLDTLDLKEAKALLDALSS